MLAIRSMALYLVELENALVRRGALHSLLEVFLPDSRPRPVVPVGDAVLDDGAGRDGLQSAVHVPERLLTLLPLIALLGVLSREKCVQRLEMQRCDERQRIVDRDLEVNVALRVAREHFDRFELVAELGQRMR